LNGLVSVIIPVFNGQKTIVDSVCSVLQQTYKNLEIILIDDKSEDHSYEILKNAFGTVDKVSIYRNAENIGVARTRNLGISLAKGQYVAFLDSDDKWTIHKLENQIEFFKRNPDIAFCYTGYDMVDYLDDFSKTMRVDCTVSYESLLKENIICCSSVLIKYKIIKDNYFPIGYFHEDFALWLNLLKKGNQAGGINESLVIYTKGGRSADKVKAFKNRWKVYRTCERLGVLKSIYYSIFYVFHGLKKYLRR